MVSKKKTVSSFIFSPDPAGGKSGRKNKYRKVSSAFLKAEKLASTADPGPHKKQSKWEIFQTRFAQT